MSTRLLGVIFYFLDFSMTHFSYIKELRLTQVSLAVTATAAALLIWTTGTVATTALAQGHLGYLLEALLFGALAGFLVYGNLCYQLARLGQLKRDASFHLSALAPTKPFDPLSAPALTVLVPSYKEELPVIRQTLLSAALQNYPNKRVVLLLDDPPAPKTRSDRAGLWAARNLPFELQALLDEPAGHIAQARAAFQARRTNRTAAVSDECVRLSDCFRLATQWFETQAKHSPTDTHTDVWFVEHVLNQSAESCREQSARWFASRRESASTSNEQLLAEIDDANWERVIRETVGRTKQELLADIGLGKQLPAVVARRLLKRVDSAQDAKGKAAQVVIRGTEGMAVQLASCCRPIPGDAIVGSMKKGQGLVVHNAECAHIERSRKNEPEQWLDVEWDPAGTRLYQSAIRVMVENQRGVLAKVASEIADSGSNIDSISMDEDRSVYTSMLLVVEVSNRQHLARVMRALRRLPDVKKLARVRE